MGKTPYGERAPITLDYQMDEFNEFELSSGCTVAVGIFHTHPPLTKWLVPGEKQRKETWGLPITIIPLVMGFPDLYMIILEIKVYIIQKME